MRQLLKVLAPFLALYFIQVSGQDEETTKCPTVACGVLQADDYDDWCVRIDVTVPP